jgi:hypothetical protein
MICKLRIILKASDLNLIITELTVDKYLRKN